LDKPRPRHGSIRHAVIITLICGALVVFWLTHDRAKLDQLPMAPRLSARWHRIPQAMRRAIGSACLCVLVGAGLAVILIIASH
jgi:hypothetical protein